MAGLCHIRAVPPLGSTAGLQRTGGPTHGPGQADSWDELVACLLTLVCSWWPQHLLHSHRIHPPLSRRREAARGAALDVGSDRAQPQTGVWGAAMPEIGWTEPGTKWFVVRAYCFPTFHPSAAAHDSCLSCQLEDKPSAHTPVDLCEWKGLLQESFKPGGVNRCEPQNHCELFFFFLYSNGSSMWTWHHKQCLK